MPANALVLYLNRIIINQNYLKSPISVAYYRQKTPLNPQKIRYDVVHGGYIRAP